jgi:hypothetical protein
MGKGSLGVIRCVDLLIHVGSELIVPCGILWENVTDFPLVSP